MSEETFSAETLERVSNQNASLYSYEAFRYSRWNLALNAISVVMSAFLLTIALGSDDFFSRTLGISSDIQKWILAFLSFINFSFVLILLVWQPGAKSSQNMAASKYYSQLRRKIKVLLDRPESLTREILISLNNEYNQNDEFPLIGDRYFLKYKRKHLRKIDISKRISKNPHENLFMAKRRLKSLKIAECPSRGEDVQFGTLKGEQKPTNTGVR
jgi:hypothetical protein